MFPCSFPLSSATFVLIRKRNSWSYFIQTNLLLSVARGNLKWQCFSFVVIVVVNVKKNVYKRFDTELYLFYLKHPTNLVNLLTEAYTHTLKLRLTFSASRETNKNKKRTHVIEAAMYVDYGPYALCRFS